MIINEKLKKDFWDLNQYLELTIKNNSLTDIQLENFLKNFEKIRYNILSEIKIYNNNTTFQHEKIKNINDEYKCELKNNVLKIYIPEVLPSFKNLKTHTHKRILLNILECTKKYSNLFNDEVFIYIKIFDKILGWDVDNKYIKPVADALVLNKVIEDDNMTKMSYA